MEKQIEQLADMVRESRVVAVFTGAGVSTESGLPDFRSPGGVWTRHRPVTYQEFTGSRAAREEYWARYLEFFPPFAEVRPNDGHRAIFRLEEMGKLGGVITQNIDRLHQAAGHRRGRVIELHGRIDRTVCLSCGAGMDTSEAIERVRSGEAAPVCGVCGGWLKPATVSFGQSLPPEALEQAVDLSRNCELFLAIGSSLQVQPAASLPALALESGARLAIINAEETPYDKYAHLVVHGPAGPVLSGMIELLGRST